MTAVWIDFSKTSSTTRPLNPQGVLPEVLADNRPNPPKEVDRATIYKERPTYYYCYRLILLLYSIAFEYETSGMRSALPQMLDNWHSQKYYMVKYFRAKPLIHRDPPKRSPIAVSMLKGKSDRHCVCWSSPASSSNLLNRNTCLQRIRC